MYNEKEIEEIKVELRKENIEVLERKIKSLQSLKCRWKKIENKKDDMEKLLIDERIIKEVIIEKKEIKVVIYERSYEEISCMNYEEVMKGIKNIDSILCIERSKGDEWRNEEKIEKCGVVREWLVSRKEIVSGNNLGKISVIDILRKLEDVGSVNELKDWLIEKSGVSKEEIEKMLIEE